MSEQHLQKINNVRWKTQEELEADGLLIWTGSSWLLNDSEGNTYRETRVVPTFLGKRVSMVSLKAKNRNPFFSFVREFFRSDFLNLPQGFVSEYAEFFKPHDGE